MSTIETISSLLVIITSLLAILNFFEIYTYRDLKIDLSKFKPSQTNKENKNNKVDKRTAFFLFYAISVPIYCSFYFF